MAGSWPTSRTPRPNRATSNAAGSCSIRPRSCCRRTPAGCCTTSGRCCTSEPAATRRRSPSTASRWRCCARRPTPGTWPGRCSTGAICSSPGGGSARRGPTWTGAPTCRGRTTWIGSCRWPSTVSATSRISPATCPPPFAHTAAWPSFTRVSSRGFCRCSRSTGPARSPRPAFSARRTTSSRTRWSSSTGIGCNRITPRRCWPAPRTRCPRETVRPRAGGRRLPGAGSSAARTNAGRPPPAWSSCGHSRRPDSPPPPGAGSPSRPARWPGRSPRWACPSRHARPA